MVDDLLESNMFGKDKISLKDIDDFISQHKLNFNLNDCSPEQEA